MRAGGQLGPPLPTAAARPRFAAAPSPKARLEAVIGAGRGWYPGRGRRAAPPADLELLPPPAPTIVRAAPKPRRDQSVTGLKAAIGRAKRPGDRGGGHASTVSLAADDLADGAERLGAWWSGRHHGGALLGLQLRGWRPPPRWASPPSGSRCQRCWCARRLARATRRARPSASSTSRRPSSRTCGPTSTAQLRGAASALQARSGARLAVGDGAHLRRASPAARAEGGRHRRRRRRERRRRGDAGARAARQGARRRRQGVAARRGRRRQRARRRRRRRRRRVGGDGRCAAGSVPHVDVEISTLGALPLAPAPRS